ncbi:MAG: hypothetical protein ABSG03_28065 [Bryobacteraceae bacterium]
MAAFGPSNGGERGLPLEHRLAELVWQAGQGAKPPVLQSQQPTQRTVRGRFGMPSTGEFRW